MGRLITAAQVPGEHRHVLRSVATALAKEPLIRWQAVAALRAIRGEG